MVLSEELCDENIQVLVDKRNYYAAYKSLIK